MEKGKVVYYTDELNDEFSGAEIEPRMIDEKYKYRRNFLWDFCSSIFQNILSMPIKIGYAKVKFRIKYVGKEKLKKYRKQGYFVYVNHTQVFADTFIPSVPIYPKRNFFIVNPENISMKPFGWLVELLGAIPVPANRGAMKNFLDEIEYRIHKNHSITIYPEAHIWPYYTKIRPFKSVSFAYPIKFGVPCFCMTNTYQKCGKNGDKVKIVTYIDGPFLADDRLSGKAQKEELRNRVYECMCLRSMKSDVEVIRYEKK